MKPSVLVIDDDETFRSVTAHALGGDGFDVATAPTGEDGLRMFQADPADFVILDRNLPDIDGLAVLRRMVAESQGRGFDTLVVVATAHTDVDGAVQAIKAGAFDYLPKPVRLSELIVTFRRAVEKRRLLGRARNLHQRHEAGLGEIVVGRSAQMSHLMQMVQRVSAAADTGVLIQGESGTGKELVANLIHRLTPGRADQPFVEINCGALPETLLESEIFGYERGAFTDAKAQKRGLFEQADGGTLFLDEIGETRPGTQAKLLKVLEGMTFRRLGGTRDLKVNVRLIAATNKDLASEVARGAFRLDLYHRLDVFHLEIAPLRERRDDILPLARHFLQMFSRSMRKPGLGFAAEVERTLRAYDYAGNVRELRNVIERAVILTSQPVVGPESIVLSGPSPMRRHTPDFFFVDQLSGGRVPTWGEVERAYVARVLAFAKGNRSQASRLLEMSYPTVAKKISEHVAGMKGGLGRGAKQAGA
jgi:two-component system, NtrC family, response regulator AtoC